MKLLVVLVIGLIVLGAFVNSYYTDENEVVKRGVNKLTEKDCELKTLPNGWTQIQNCALYKMKEENK